MCVCRQAWAWEEAIYGRKEACLEAGRKQEPSLVSFCILWEGALSLQPFLFLGEEGAGHSNVSDRPVSLSRLSSSLLF